MTNTIFGENRGPLLAHLPTIIDGPGLYQLRSGRTALIHQIVPGTSTFEAKGAIGVQRRGKVRYEGLEIWHVSGRYAVLAETCNDIVGKVQG